MWSDIDQDTSSTTTLLEKRGGKGVDRHLIAGATAATFATLTALMTITGNTIKAHDQNKYGVSRKDAASSSPSSSREVVKSHGAEKGKIEVKADSTDSIKQQPPSSNTDSPHQNTTVINNFFYLHHGPKEINLLARQIPPGVEEREQTHLVRRAGLKGRLHGLDPYQKVFEKVEDYGKIGASLGAVTAASIATYSALQAHRAYVLKASKDSSPGGRLQQDNSTKV